MSILVSQKILDCIRDELSASRESFLLISAYCKLPLVKYFDSCIVNTSIEKKLVVRFRPDDTLFFIVKSLGNTAQFTANALRTAPAAAAHHLRCKNAREYTKYYLRFLLSSWRTSLDVSVRRIMRCCP